MLVDEAVFQPRKYDTMHWSPSRQAFTRNRRWQPGKYWSVIAAISAEDGFICHRQNEGAQTAVDVGGFIWDVFREKEGRPFVLFWDNCSTHRSKVVTAELDLMGVEGIRNVPYRPEFNGIEVWWVKVKKEFRARLNDCVIQELEIDLPALI